MTAISLKLKKVHTSFINLLHMAGVDKGLLKRSIFYILLDEA